MFLGFLALLFRTVGRKLAKTGDALPYAFFIVLLFYLFKAGGGLLNPLTWILFAYIATSDSKNIAPRSITRRPQPASRQLKKSYA